MFGSIRPGAKELLPSSFSAHERNHLFLNRAGSQFVDISGVSGLDHDGDSRAFALIDYDRDGWQDIVLVNANAPMLQMFRNQIASSGSAAGGDIIALRFVGGHHGQTPTKGWSNRDGIGAMVTIETGGRKLVREHRAGEGFAAQNSATMIIGIGKADEVSSVSIRWPSGRTQTMTGIPAGSLITAYENEQQSPGSEAATIQAYRTSEPSEPAPRKLASLRPPNTLELPNATPSRGLRLFTTTATWCPFCKFWLPQLRTLANTFGDALHSYGVPVDPKDTAKMYAEYQEKFDPAYTLLMGLSAEEVDRVKRITAPRFGADTLPTTVVTDTSGRILLSTSGIPTVSQICRLLREQGVSSEVAACRSPS